MGYSAFQSAMRQSGYWQRRYFSRFKPEVICAGSLTANPSSYPVSELAISVTSGSTSDIYGGFVVHIYKSTGEWKGTTRVRFAGTIDATHLPIRETSRASIAFANGDLFEVCAQIYPDSKVPTADSDFNPDGQAVGTFGEHPKAICCSGGAWVGWVDGIHTSTPAAFATVKMFGSRSHCLDTTSDPANFVHLWVLPTGCAFQSGSVDSDEDPILECDANKDGYLIRHELTDENGEVTIQHVQIIVHNKTTHPPYQCLARAMTYDAISGFTWEVQLFEGLTRTDFPYGAQCWLWKDELLGGVMQSIGSVVEGREHIIAVGYARRSTNRSETGNETFTLELISPMARLLETNGFSNVMIRAASPTTWLDVSNLTVALAIGRFWIFYNNMPEAGYDYTVHDLYQDYDYPVLFTNKGNPAGQIQELARATQARFVSYRWGGFELIPVVNLLDTTTRDTLDIFLEIERQDIISIEVVVEYFEAVDEVIAEGFVAHATDPTPTRVKYPGNSPGGGTVREEIKGLIFASVEAAKAIVGRIGNRINRIHLKPTTLIKRLAPYVRIDLPMSYAGAFDFYPGYVNLPFATRMDEFDLEQYRYEIDSIELTFNDQGTGVVRLGLQAETDGVEGVEYPFEQTDTSSLSDASSIFPTLSFSPFAPINPFTSSTVNLVVWMWRDESAGTSSFYTTPDGLNFTEHTFAGLGINGKLIDAPVDPFSPRYNGGGALNGWILTDAEVRRITDVDGSPAVGTAYDFGLVGGDVVYGGAIHTNIAARNFVVVELIIVNSGTPARSGTYLFVTTDGTNWTGGQYSTNTTVTSDTHRYRIGLAVSPHNAGWVFASEQTSAPLLRILKSTDYAVTWSVFHSFSSANSYICNGIHIPYHSNSDDEILFYTHLGSPTLTKLDNGVRTELTMPTLSGSATAPYGPVGLDSYVANRDIMSAGLTFLNDPTTESYGFAQSTDGATWSPSTLTNTRSLGVAIAGDNSDVQWRWGSDGTLEQTTNGGSSWSDVSGDLPGGGASAGDDKIWRIWGA